MVTFRTFWIGLRKYFFTRSIYMFKIVFVLNIFQGKSKKILYCAWKSTLLYKIHMNPNIRILIYPRSPLVQTIFKTKRKHHMLAQYVVSGEGKQLEVLALRDSIQQAPSSEKVIKRFFLTSHINSRIHHC